ncbi:hypothetical protein INR49_014570 [Caranx melampygus]|nr:hypothetical protein INR49_014570 [Caranx melampygus]
MRVSIVQSHSSGVGLRALQGTGGNAGEAVIMPKFHLKRLSHDRRETSRMGLFTEAVLGSKQIKVLNSSALKPWAGTQETVSYGSRRLPTAKVPLPTGTLVSARGRNLTGRHHGDLTRKPR